jgi:rubrerythrin
MPDRDGPALEVITLEMVDDDCAIQETAEEALGSTRASFLRKAAIGGTSLLGGGLLLGGFPKLAMAEKSPQQDLAILNFALTLEYLESEFYVQGVRSAGLTGRLRALSIVVRDHELTHVRALRSVISQLGGRPVAKPRFDFRNTVRSRSLFHSTAIALEDTGVTAYGGQAANIAQAPVLSTAAQILAIEARHAAAFRQLRGLRPAPLAFNPTRTSAQVKAAVQRTHFVVGSAPGLG